MPLFYISFAKAKKEGGFLGATVVEAPNEMQAVPVATLRGLNPGGEAAILLVPDEVWLEHPEHHRMLLNRLASRDEVMAQGFVRRPQLSKKEKARFDERTLFVCSCCNPPRVH